MNNLSFENLPQAVSELNVKLSNIESLLKELRNQNSSEQTDELFTIEQAAEFLKLTVPTMYGKVHRKEVPCMKQGKRLYFSKLELIAYIKDGRLRTTYELEQAANDYLSTKKRLNNG